MGLIEEEYRCCKVRYEEFCTEVKILIEKLIKNNDINYQSITSRIKTEESLSRKISKKGGKYKELSDITDIAGIRIITLMEDDVDRIAAILRTEFEIDEENSIDKRKVIDPKSFGYLSLHYIIRLNNIRLQLPEYKKYNEMRIEIQIRSVLQHAWAEIEHDLGYKSYIGVPKEYVRRFSRIAGLLELADQEFVHIKNELKQYEDNIKAEINNRALMEEILIDKVSLNEYIKGNKFYRLLAENICNYAGAEIISNDNEIDIELLRLKYLRITNMKQLDMELERNKNLMFFIVSVIFREDRGEKLLETIGIFYLAYALIIQEESKEELTTYMNTFHIGDEETNGEFAESLIAEYRVHLERYNRKMELI